eukprot:4103686-Amphidinium_carterae.1
MSLYSITLWMLWVPGELPETLFSLTSLKILEVAWNSFTGRLPVGIAGLSSAKNFAVNMNSFAGNLPSALY